MTGFTDRCLAVRGVGLRLPGDVDPAALPALLARPRTPAAHPVRRYAAAGTDLAPVDRRVFAPAEPALPAGVPGRGLRALPHECVLALAAAAAALPPADGADPAAPTAVLWASSTAGLLEYATVCVEAALLEPGLTDPLLGPASGFNAPAATVSIRLGLAGPNETLTGDRTAGLATLVEAGRLIAAGDAVRALVGGSATVSRWSLAGAAPDAVPAEGAGCLAVAPWRGPDDGIRLGPARRVGLVDPARAVAQVSDLVRHSGAGPPPAALVVSTGDAELAEALIKEQHGPVWHVERTLGDFGAAGGLLAVLGAVAYCAERAPARVLAVAVEPTGNAIVLEVSSW